MAALSAFACVAAVWVVLLTTSGGQYVLTLMGGHRNSLGSYTWSESAAERKPVACDAGLNRRISDVQEADPDGSFSETPYTIVTQVYGRHKLWQLRDFASRYAGDAARDAGCVGLVVVWNNLQVTPPHPSEIEATVPVRVIRMRRNSMNNRFLVRRHIDTDAVVLVDDDLRIEQSALSRATWAWRDHPRQIVGFLPRAHMVHESDDGVSVTYSFFPLPSGHYSMVLVGASVFHRDLMEAYAANTQLQAYVDEVFNCDDIGLNMLASSLSGLPPVHVQGEVVSVMDVTRHGGLSEQGGWMNMRDKCLSELPGRAFNGTLPLRWTKLSIAAPGQDYRVLRADGQDVPVEPRDWPWRELRTRLLAAAASQRESQPASLVITAWKRLQNVAKVVCQAAVNYPFLTEFIMVQNSLEVDVSKALQEAACAVSLEGKVTVLAQQKNIFTQAKYVGCQAARNDLCFIIDDDFLPSNLNSLHALAAANQNVITVGTDASSWVLSRKWSFLDIAADLHTGFTWLGTGAFVPRHLALKFLELQEALAFTDEQKRFADLYFSLLLNELPTVVQQSLDQEGLDTSGAFSCSTCTDNRAKNSEHQLRALRIVEECLGNDDCPIQRDFKSRKSLSGVHKAISHGDSAVFMSSVDPVSDNWCITAVRTSPFAKGWAPEHGSFHFIRAVDGDDATAWHMHRPLAATDWVGLDLLHLRLVQAVRIKWSGCREESALNMLATEDGHRWFAVPFFRDDHERSLLRFPHGTQAMRAFKLRCAGGTAEPVELYSLEWVARPEEAYVSAQGSVFLSSWGHASALDPVLQAAIEASATSHVVLVLAGDSGRQATHSLTSVPTLPDSLSVLSLESVLRRGITGVDSVEPDEGFSSTAVALAEWLERTAFDIVHFDAKVPWVFVAVQKRRMQTSFAEATFIAHWLPADDVGVAHTGRDTRSLLLPTAVELVKLADVAVFHSQHEMDVGLGPFASDHHSCVPLVLPTSSHAELIVRDSTELPPDVLVIGQSTPFSKLQLYQLIDAVKVSSLAGEKTWLVLVDTQDAHRPLLVDLLLKAGCSRTPASGRHESFKHDMFTVVLSDPVSIPASGRLVLLPSSRSQPLLVQAAARQGVRVVAPSHYMSVLSSRAAETCGCFYPVESGVYGLARAIQSCRSLDCLGYHEALAPAPQNAMSIAKLELLIRFSHAQSKSGAAPSPEVAGTVTVVMLAVADPAITEAAVRSVLNDATPTTEVAVIDPLPRGATQAVWDGLNAELRAAGHADVVQLPLEGKAHSLNHAASMATGESLLFLLNGVKLSPGALPVFLRARAKDVADLLTPWTLRHASQPSSAGPGVTELLAPASGWRDSILSGTVQREDAVFVNREAFLDIGGFSDTLTEHGWGICSLAARMLAAGKRARRLPERLVVATKYALADTSEGSESDSLFAGICWQELGALATEALVGT